MTTGNTVVSTVQTEARHPTPPMALRLCVQLNATVVGQCHWCYVSSIPFKSKACVVLTALWILWPGCYEVAICSWAELVSSAWTSNNAVWGFELQNPSNQQHFATQQVVKGSEYLQYQVFIILPSSHSVATQICWPAYTQRDFQQHFLRLPMVNH